MTAAANTGEQTRSGQIRGPVVVRPGEGERLEFLGGSTMVLKLSDPAESVSFYEYTSEPTVAGAPQHLHHGHDETFYVTQGTYGFRVGDDTVVLAEGGFLSVPAGTPHTFRNVGQTTGRLIGTFSSSNFSNYFRELAEIIRTTGGPPNLEEWTRLYARYNTTFRDNASPS